MIFHGRKISPGSAEGGALVSCMGISFYGGIDPETGQVVEKGHALEGQSIGGKVLVFPTGKGSTVGSYTLYRLKKAGNAPAAILNAEFRGGDSIDGSQQNRHVFGTTARHDTVYRHIPNCRFAVFRQHFTDNFSRLSFREFQELVDLFQCRRDDRQSVGPQIFIEMLLDFV